MKLIRYSARYACTGLLLGFTLAVGPTACVAAASQLETAQPALPKDDIGFVPAAPQPGAAQPTPPKDDTGREEVFPLPEAGATAYFRYARDRGDMYQIIPTDGSQPYLVSASFLRVTLDNPLLGSFQQAELLRTYPALMQEMFTKTMAQVYPDGTAEPEAPFSTRSFEGTDGTQGLLEQDPAAAPYIRVRLTNGKGELVEFSVARAVVEQMLANAQLTDDQLLKGLQSFPFRLPEAARAGDFARLSAAELAILVQNEPELRQYEFVQMGRLSSDGTEDRSAKMPRRPRGPRVEQRPAATALSAAPLGVQQRPALAPPPPQPLTTAGTGEQPQPDSRAYAPGIDGLSPQVAEPLKRAPVPSTEAVSADGIQTSAWRLGLQIVSIALFAFGIIALVVSRRTR